MARMRHPNVVSFMGLCRMPPCILTGEPAWISLNSNRAAAAPATAATATAAAAAGAAAATAAAAARHRSSPATGLLHCPLFAEYCPQGSLYDVLHKAAQQASVAAQLTWQLRLTMVRMCQ